MGRQRPDYFFLYFYSHLQPRDFPVFFISMFLMLAKLVKFMSTNHLFFLWFIWIPDKIHTLSLKCLGPIAQQTPLDQSATLPPAFRFEGSKM